MDNKETISEIRAYISYPQFGPVLIPLITCINKNKGLIIYKTQIKSSG